MFFGEMGSWIFYILAILAVLVLIVWIIIRVIIHFIQGNKPRKAIGSKNWYLQMSLSREDALSQVLFLVGFAFLGVTMFTFNRNLGAPLEWYTIIYIASVIGLSAAYYFKLIYTLGFSLMGLIVWWVALSSSWADPKQIQPSVIFAMVAWFALLLLVTGTLHEVKRQYKRAATVYEVLGIIMMAGILFFLSSNAGLEAFEGMLKGKPFYASWQLSLSLIILFATLVVAIGFGVWKKLLHTQEAATMGILATLFLVIAFMSPTSLYESSSGYYYNSGAGSLTSSGAFWAMAFNVLTLLGLLSVMLAGNLRRETWQINLGAALLFIYIFVKYFDWFYTFLDKSVFFIGAGILFFVIGWIMERSRRHIIQKIAAESPVINTSGPV